MAHAGYEVELLEPHELHVEQARVTSAAQPDAAFLVELGDARKIARSNNYADVVLMLDPLYHLPDPDDCRQAFAEARRVLIGGGVLVAAAISRYASLIDGVRLGDLVGVAAKPSSLSRAAEPRR